MKVRQEEAKKRKEEQEEEARRQQKREREVGPELGEMKRKALGRTHRQRALMSFSFSPLTL